MSKEAEYLRHKKKTLADIIEKYNKRTWELYPIDSDNIDISKQFCASNDICRECGNCCKKCPCTYSPYDFLDIEDIDYMRRILDTGVVTLVNYNNYYPYVIRNRGILDSESVAGKDNDSGINKCLLLSENGCMYQMNIELVKVFC